MACICRTDAAAQATHCIVGLVGGNLLLGARKAHELLVLDRGPVADERVEEIGNNPLAHIAEIGNVVETQSSPEQTKAAEHKKPLTRQERRKGR